jgi:ubiquitin fusion degradation protein 1
MPESALHELSRIHTSYPMTFMISNPEMGIKTYCGNLEFVAQEGSCNIPIWMMNLLCLEEGSEVIIRNVNLKKGTHIKF